MVWVWIFAFGLVGVGLRYALETAGAGFTASFPWVTLLINVAGCFVAGFLFRLDFSWPVELRTGLIVGFCGGFTTFSAYSLQAFLLLDRGAALPAMLYLFGSPVLGIFAAGMGFSLARMVG